MIQVREGGIAGEPLAARRGTLALVAKSGRCHAPLAHAERASFPLPLCPVCHADSGDNLTPAARQEVDDCLQQLDNLGEAKASRASAVLASFGAVVEVAAPACLLASRLARLHY